jgi:hypothetical protein
MQIVTRETGNRRNFERKYLDVVLFRWKQIPVTTLHNILLFLLLAPACYERAWTDGKFIMEKRNLRGTTEVIVECMQKRERERRKIGVMEHHYN